MNTPPNAVPQSFDAQSTPSAPMSATRPMYWSVRRELWENRSIYIAPLAAAGVYMAGDFISLLWMSHHMRHAAELDPAHQLIEMAMPYAHAGMLLMATAFLVGIFYSLDALYGERRDRSILFWKSLPVSDLTTVLAKASIPLVVLPTIAFLLTMGLQIVMRLIDSAARGVSGGGAAMLWERLPFFEMELVLLYSFVVVALWHAPIYCWMLLVSGWARRAAFLWAILPVLTLAAVEYIAFHTSFLGSLLRDRLFGFTEAAFDLRDKAGMPVDAHYIPLERLDPGKFVTSSGLWVGLVFSAICLAVAVRLRREREPL